MLRIDTICEDYNVILAVEQLYILRIQFFANLRPVTLFDFAELGRPTTYSGSDEFLIVATPVLPQIPQVVRDV